MTKLLLALPLGAMMCTALVMAFARRSDSARARMCVPELVPDSTAPLLAFTRLATRLRVSLMGETVPSHLCCSAPPPARCTSAQDTGPASAHTTTTMRPKTTTVHCRANVIKGGWEVRIAVFPSRAWYVTTMLRGQCFLCTDTIPEFRVLVASHVWCAVEPGAG